MSCAPEFTFYTSLFSCFLMPLTIVVTNIVFLCIDKHEVQTVKPLIVLILCNQVVALIFNGVTMLGVLMGDLMYWQGEREGYITLYRRGVEAGDIYKS